MSVLARINWQSVTKDVLAQQGNREDHTPAISVFRWWARRPHALIGAILDAAVRDCPRGRLHVSDPFSGGGTVAFEAARRGLPTYAQDLYPWPTTGLAVGLARCSVPDFLDAASRLLASLAHLRPSYCREDGIELSHIIRVRLGVCPKCRGRIHLFPYPLISLASRSKNEQKAYFGCSACGAIHRDARDIASWKCSCGRRNTTSACPSGTLGCPHCDFSVRPREFFGKQPEWNPVLVQEIRVMEGRERASLRPADPDDPTEAVPASEEFSEMRQPIPEGLETHRLRESGFAFWGDLYTARQARVLIDGLRLIKGTDVVEACKNRMALALIGTAEMPAFLSRWERFHLKAFEALANHHYSDTTLVVETNPLSPIGRGTLPQRLKSAVKALDWALRDLPPSLPSKQVHATGKAVDPVEGIYIATGNSSRQALKDGVIELVLTDPPYYDDVQYGELARLFHYWLAKYQHLSDFSENEEAVPNRHRDAQHEFYVKSIAACFQECQRTLAPGGRLILTFHNKKMQAWRALSAALQRSRFAIRSIAVVRAENAADHGKRNGKGMLHDLVLECLRQEEWNGRRVTTFGDRSNALHAMGIALAKTIRSGTPDRLDDFFKKEAQRLGITERLIR